MAGHSTRDCFGEAAGAGIVLFFHKEWAGGGGGKTREGKERSPRDCGAGGVGADEGWMAGEECNCIEEGEQVLGRGLEEKVRGPGGVA